MNTLVEIEADAAEIVQFYIQDLLTEKQISGLYECSPDEILDVLCSQGVQLRPKGFIATKKHPAWNHAAEIARLYDEERVPAQKLADMYNTNSPMICRIIRSQGVQIRPKTAKDHPAWNHAAEIARLYDEEHIPVLKLSKTYKCSTHVIYWILCSQGIELRPKRLKMEGQ